MSPAKKEMTLGAGNEVRAVSLKKNILATYAGQIYATLIGIVILPMYIRYMGAEAYGLVGFYSMLQSLFNLLDLGLSPTVARETARFRGGALDAYAFRRLVRALEGIFIAIAITGAGVLLLLSGQIATNWLVAKRLPISEIQRSIQLMAIAITLRWVSGLYRGQITGSERLVWLSGYGSLIATIRFVGVLGVLIFISASPVAYFSYQLGVAIVELGGVTLVAYRMLPPIPEGKRAAWSWAPLKPILKFSLTIAFTSAVWVLVTQTDKVVLSKILPLSEYGYYSLAVLAASGVMMISGPVGSALMPRMARLEAEGDGAGLIRVYRETTQLVAVFAGAAAVTIAFCSRPLMLAWTGDKTLASFAVPILVPYAVGNAILAISAFPYYLQYAKGNLNLHLIGNAGFVIILIPTIIWAASHYGGLGAGFVWLGMNIIYFLAWIPFIHREFAPGLNIPWYLHDVLTIAAVATLAGYVVSRLIPKTSSRLGLAASVILVGLVVLFASACSSSAVRKMVHRIVRRWREKKEVKLYELG